MKKFSSSIPIKFKHLLLNIYSESSIILPEPIALNVKMNVNCKLPLVPPYLYDAIYIFPCIRCNLQNDAKLRCSRTFCAYAVIMLFYGWGNNFISSKINTLNNSSNSNSNNNNQIPLIAFATAPPMDVAYFVNCCCTNQQQNTQHKSWRKKLVQIRAAIWSEWELFVHSINCDWNFEIHFAPQHLNQFKKIAMVSTFYAQFKLIGHVT